MAWDGGATGRRRVFVEDLRANGQFLRATWHRDGRVFVVSNWEDTVCVGATRIPVEAGSELIGLLAAGLTEAATSTPPAAPPADRTLADHLRTWWRARRTTAPVVQLTPGSTQVQRSA